MQHHFRNLVFEGGGVKGIAYAGALSVLEEKGILPRIRRVAGTSAGAITAAIVALGANSSQVDEILSHTDFRSFMDDSWGIVRDTHRLVNRYGWHKGDTFADWMKRQVYSLTDRPDLTFAQLRALAADDPDRYKDLWMIGSNLTAQIPQVFNADRTPDEPIWRAVRISMSIPLFFEAVERDGDLLVDGGVTWNYPIDLFDDKQFLHGAPASHSAALPPERCYDADSVYNKETLGLRVDAANEIEAERNGWRRPPKQVENLGDYLAVLVGYMMDQANRSHLREEDWHRTIFIDSKGVGTVEFGISDERVRELAKSGRDCAAEYFKWLESAPEAHNRIA